MTHLLRLVAALVALSFVFAAHAAPVIFDIPAQPAAAALKSFGKQAKVEVIFRADELRDAPAKEVKGELEPAEAIARLLSGTGFEARQTAPSNFVVSRVKTSTSGSVRGWLMFPGGAPAAGVRVMVRETRQSVETDKDGQFLFSAVAPGSHLLEARADGYQPLHITDVFVKAGNELSLSRETLRKPADGLTALEPFVVRGEVVTELDKYSVYGAKEKPFAGVNVDIPRSINDAQPYVIFESKNIERSGSVNVEDFLKQQLTMNASWLRSGVGSNLGVTVAGASNSTIDLRGIGSDKTLILVNGRRQMATSNSGATGQPDLNLIPLSLIERVEVLPTSASGIYGGSAIGGVVNVILKRNFTGGEIRMNYASPFDTDAPTATVAANYGLSLEGGRTQMRFGISWSDGKEFTLGERQEIYLANLDRILANFPTYFNLFAYGFASERVNITAASTTQTTLTLKNGTVLTAPRTFVGPGISATSPVSELSASLAANTGQFSRGMADANNLYSAGASLGLVPRNTAYSANLRREMTPWLEVFSDFSYTGEQFQSVYNPFGWFITSVPASAPTNPFTTGVSFRAPSTAGEPMSRESINRALTVGALLRLPAGWTAEMDYSWSGGSARYAYSLNDSTALSADISRGTFNPFVDTVRYPLSFGRYLATVGSSQTSGLDDYALRTNGSLPALPWGPVNLTVGLEHRVEKNGTQIIDTIYPLTPTRTSRQVYFPKKSRTDSAYVEAQVPLVSRDRFKFVHGLELQVAGRTERFEADTGTSGTQTAYLRTPPTTFILGANRNDEPVFGSATYASTDFTVAVKYQPRSDITIRASRGTAFLPPTPDQLAPRNTPDLFPSIVIDPATGASVEVITAGGGNPNLVPQNSVSTNAGVIWEPRTGPLGGLRFNAEYYNIEQFDYIATPTEQDVVNNTALFPGRVTRNASGVITQVDTSYANLYRRQTEGVDLSFDSSLKTGAGLFNLRGAETFVFHNYNQYSLTQPEVDSVGFPSDGGGLKRKRNLSLNWERSHWSAGWTVRYFGSYGQSGAANSPQVLRTPASAAGLRNQFILPQGGDTIPSQTYHDAFVGYTFRASDRAAGGRGTRTLLDGLQVEAGIRNVFGKVPPLDMFSVYNLYYVSQYGDLKLRTYWVSVRKQF